MFVESIGHMVGSARSKVLFKTERVVAFLPLHLEFNAEGKLAS